MSFAAGRLLRSKNTCCKVPLLLLFMFRHLFPVYFQDGYDKVKTYEEGKNLHLFSSQVRFSVCLAFPEAGS